MFCAAAETPEFGNKIADGALAAGVSVIADITSDQPFEVLVRIPVCRCRIRWEPFLPCGVCRLDGCVLAIPVNSDMQMRIEPGVLRGDL